MAKDHFVSHARQPGVGMEKQQHLAPCASHPRGHLHGPAAWCINHGIRQREGQFRRAVLATAVRHDDFMTALAYVLFSLLGVPICIYVPHFFLTKGNNQGRSIKPSCVYVPCKMI